MIILPDRKLIIITPPKTASTSLHKGLGAVGAIWVNGFALSGRCVDHHIVGYAVGYRLFMTVRHPLDRLVSMYLHQSRFDASEGRPGEAFWCFANRVGRGEHPDPMYQWNQCKYLEPFATRPSPQVPFPNIGEFPATRSHAPYAIETQLEQGPLTPEFLHVETLAADLAAAGIDIKDLPHVNKSPVRKHWSFYFGTGGQQQSLLAVIEDWAKPDCERFGYEWPPSELTTESESEEK